jgi:hypothetical protein
VVDHVLGRLSHVQNVVIYDIKAFHISVIDFGILFQLATGILQKHFTPQAFSLRFLTSLVYFHLM